MPKKGKKGAFSGVLRLFYQILIIMWDLPYD
jgi:hypothetical protein